MRGKMKILHTADIHLKEFGDERWQALQKLIEVGKKEKIEIFIISGDLFDRNFDAEGLRPKIREIFSHTGFKILIIPGNHDCNSYKSGLYFGEETEVLTELDSPFEFKNVRIWGFPFEPIGREKILYKLHLLAKDLTPDKKNILLFHGELLDAFFSRRDFGDEGAERYMPVKISYFEDMKIDYILAGHFHSNFDVWKIENGGYFVYPGSPISITKREIGQRKVNLFELGQAPQAYPLHTPYYEQVDIELDPLMEEKPLKTVEKIFQSLHPEAKVILTIKGFVNGKAVGMSEKELVEHIKEIAADKCVEEHYEFKDIQVILEDDLFQSFKDKMEQTDYEQEEKKRMIDVAIQAMMGWQP